MAGADSTIRVNIVGDAKQLAKATDKAEGSVKGLSKSAKLLGGALVAGFAVDAVIDFGRTALAEADRVGDATGRLEAQLGDLSQPLEDAARGFTHLGLSRQDVLELEAALIDVGTALGIADEELGTLAQSSAEAAGALALITDTDAETWMATLGKAAGGSAKALKALGVSVDETDVVAAALAETGKTLASELTSGELAAARLSLVLVELEPRLTDVKTGINDTEQASAALQAEWETLVGDIGAQLETFLVNLQGFILTGVAGWDMLSDAIDANQAQIAEWLTPAARLVDVLGAIISLFQEINKIHPPSWLGTSGGGTVTFGGQAGPRGPGIGGSGPVTVNVQGGSPEAVERAVRDAVKTTARRG